MYKRLLIATFVILGLTVILGALPIHGEQEVYENVVRLHVIANSDSEEDQALKLSVRDAVLEETRDIFALCKTKAEAERVLSENIEIIEKTANDAVTKAGYNYKVTVEIGEEQYPTKNYEGCAFPAGEYTSLRIKLGEADGQNWWCVLFPPLCFIDLAGETEAVAPASTHDGESAEQAVEVRFKLLELLPF